MTVGKMAAVPLWLDKESAHRMAGSLPLRAPCWLWMVLEGKKMHRKQWGLPLVLRPGP